MAVNLPAYRAPPLWGRKSSRLENHAPSTTKPGFADLDLQADLPLNALGFAYSIVGRFQVDFGLLSLNH
jgi:hypothetical protein